MEEANRVLLDVAAMASGGGRGREGREGREGSEGGGVGGMSARARSSGKDEERKDEEGGRKRGGGGEREGPARWRSGHLSAAVHSALAPPPLPPPTSHLSNRHMLTVASPSSS